MLECEHLTVCHKKEFKNKTTGAHTNHAESVHSRVNKIVKEIYNTYFNKYLIISTITKAKNAEYTLDKFALLMAEYAEKFLIRYKTNHEIENSDGFEI